jgi:hypothetical protein
MELEALFVFIVGNTGFRIIGLFVMIKSFIKRKFNEIDILLITTMTVALLIPLFFVQRRSAYNAIQFMQLYLHIFNFYAALSIVSLLSFIKNRAARWIFIILVIILTIPTSLGNLLEFYGPGKTPLAKISNDEIEALEWIKKNTPIDSIILTKPFDRYLALRYEKQPWPISVWESTPYIFVISDRYVFLADEGQLKITGYNIEEDLEKANKFFSQLDFDFNRRFLKEKGIDYIYIRKDELPTLLNEERNGVKRVFENNEVVVYKVFE